MHIKGDKLIRDGGSDCGADLTDDAKTLREINDRLREVVEKAPSDASVQFIIRRVNNGFKGLLRIRSSHNRFVGGASGEKLFEVVNTIFSEVSGQIRGWKRTRELQAVNSASAWE